MVPALAMLERFGGGWGLGSCRPGVGKANELRKRKGWVLKKRNLCAP
jgi:hypothetical protein